ncbi:hypothetical protein [Maribacter sp. 2307ULW6-5]|uniref:hypothetical protein n=1 Tax=Maribacter sp. 2307ULW6-5 TaxID=3386275 RepID=UPI0039BCF978
MKEYKIHRNIRKKAMLFGLPLSLFALQLVSVIGSLLVLIFSFGIKVLIGAILWNIGLFLVLGQLSAHPERFLSPKVFPTSISNKQISHWPHDID